MRGRSAPRAERFRTKMLSATKVGGGCNLGRSVEERKGGREGGREVSLGRRARVAEWLEQTGRRNGRRIICWTPGSREINCSLCLRDTREFCNWMIEVGPGMIDCAALLFVAG